jgi:hypothetical protein
MATVIRLRRGRRTNRHRQTPAVIFGSTRILGVSIGGLAIDEFAIQKGDGVRRSSGDRDDALSSSESRLLFREIQDQPVERNNWVTRTKAGRADYADQRDPPFQPLSA